MKAIGLASVIFASVVILPSCTAKAPAKDRTTTETPTTKAPTLTWQEGAAKFRYEAEFLDGFKASEECHGITYISFGDADYTFRVNLFPSPVEGGRAEPQVAFGDWALRQSIAGPDKADTDTGLLIAQTDTFVRPLEQTASEVCRAIWKDVDPNHFLTPGGKIE
jgi:hypothetical protein